MGFFPEPFPQPTSICFQPCQIVCLDHATSRLYAEVIQVVEGRSMCWVRPLLLSAVPIEPFAPSNAVMAAANWHDLRNGSHLLLPAVLFRAAFDTEVMPLLTLLYETDALSDAGKLERTNHHYLSQFVQQVWKAHPDIFQM